MTVEAPLPPPLPLPAAAGEAAAESVVVAINIRPLVDSELAEGCKECLLVTPGEPQVGHGAHLFTYDHVFCEHGIAEPPGTLYDRCVAPLVDGLFRGYNATVFAYGQTGSGKTYTMGSAFTPDMGGAGAPRGVIPQVMDAIFGRIAAAPRDIDFSVRVGFVEIHKEEIHDLLCTRGGPHPAVHIREAGGGVCLAGAMEREVKTRQEMVEVLEQGTLLRATAATGMNKQSSRSHAIFTITLEQRRLVGPHPGGSGRASAAGSPGEDDSSGEDDDEAGGTEEVDDSYLCAKMHLVDLAGSERAKRTKAVGQRLQEGININKGLLALGNVINALSEGKAHVPYRDSKLTRMLQDSLGGNSRTVMIACVSPADVNLEESLNTLRYANRARNIRNKPVVNRDPVAAQIAHMRQQMAALRAENQSLKAQLGLGDGAALDFGASADDALRATVETLEQHNRTLQSENKRLRVERDSALDDLKDATEKMIVAQAQRDKLQQALERVSPEAAAEAAAVAEALAGGTSSEGDVVRGQLERIAELEREVKRLKQVSRLSGAFAASMRRQSLAPGEAPASPFALTPLIQSDGEEEADVSLLEQNDDEYAAREQAQLMHQSHLHSEMARLEREMAAKEHALLSMSQHAALKQKYDERLLDLQQQRDELQRERADLMRKLEALHHASEEERLRLREQYESRIKLLDEKVKAVRAKEKRVLELERMKSKAETACKKLEHDVLAIKQQKVSLHRAMEKSAKEFAEWKKQRDRELLQLKKQGRLNAAQLQKLEALHSKQQAVLRRKTEEAEAARRRLKELEDRKHRLASRPTTAQALPPSERPFTAPPAGAPAAAAAASQPPRPPTAGAAGSAAVERSAPSASAAASSAEAECQPNPLAPLLRDEKGRREWVEGELDAYCSSYELQKVMEGERAQRSEVQRKLREVEKALAHLRNPEWWGPATVALISPSGDCEEKLVRRKMALLAQSEEHSKAFEAAQAKLLEARQAEEARGGLPADAKRWNGVRSVVQARALLKTLFRSASQHKAQAIEASAQVTELSEEIELLKLRLDIAEAEKFEAAQQVAKYQVLLETAEAARSGSTEVEATTPAKQLLPPAVGAGDLAAETDEGLREAHEILQQLNTLANEDPLSAPAAPAAAAAVVGGAAPADVEEDKEEESPSEEESWEEEEDEEEEDASSDDEERHTLWDPSLATPARGLKARKAAAAAAGGEGRMQRRRSSAASGSGGLLPEEQPVVAHLNEQLRRQGKEPVFKPTVALMKEVLKDQVIGGRRWRLGAKKREDLVRDYRLMLGLQPSEDDSAAPTSASAPQAQQQQQQQQQQAGAAQQQQPPRGGEGASGSGAPVFSRLLEHTASSLARCADKVHHPPPSVVAATQQQQQPVAAAVAAAAAATAAAPPSRAAFGSPLPPPRNRTSTSSQDGLAQGQADAGSTPVGAEGQTPEGMAPEVQQRDGQRSAEAGLSPDGKRNLQLQDLHSQLTALAQQGVVTLGLNPNVGGPNPARPATSGAPPDERQRSPSPPRSGAGGQQGGSPFRRSFSLASWARSASPHSPVRAAGHPARPDEQQPPSPGAAAAAAQRTDAEVQRAGSGSPGRLARLFGRAGSVAADGSRAKQGGAAAAATPPVGEATYELQQPVRQDKPGVAGRQGGPASHPLRCSNSSEVVGSGGSRAGSPRDAGLAASCARASSTGPSPLEQPSAGRPRSGGSNPSGSAVPPHRSPRRQVWKPL